MTPRQLELLHAALRYAERRWAVFPIFEILEDLGCACGKPDCSSPGKHPRTPHGLKDASTDPDVIRHWWGKRWPGASIAIRTGAASGLDVVDVDPKKGGEDSLSALVQERGPLPVTVEALTGGGGRHLLFAHDPDHDPAFGVGTDVFGPGLDARGEGGYIVAPPSLHACGRPYAWNVDAHPDEVPLAQAPEWLLAFFAPAPPSPTAVPNPDDPEPIDRPGVEPAAAEQTGGRILTWALHRVTKGQGRNVVGFDLSCQLRDNGLSLAQAREWISQYARKVANQGDHPYALAEAEKSLRQAYQRPAREPWTGPGPVPLVGVGSEVFAAHRAARANERAKLRPFTDLGNAERLIDRHGADLRYAYLWDTWLVWDGTRWAKDETNQVMRLAKGTVRSIHDGLSQIQDLETQKEAFKHAQRSEAAGRLQAMLELAHSEEGVPVLPDDLDSDPWILNCLNGTLDLRTGELLPHDPRRLCHKLLPVAFDPAATCPRWEAFLDRVMGGKAHMTAFLQRTAGYALTGSTREQCLWILHGAGANGKSVFMGVLERLMGDYATRTESKTFIEKKSDAISNDLARLKGSRLVLASETESGRRLAESLVKQVTGGERMTARFLHREFFEFVPEFKLLLATNHKPAIKGTDHAIWRRIRLTPFEVVIPPEERDPNLTEKLLEELAGILAWAVRGCLEWQKAGLAPPDEVVQATDDYRESMDSMASFFEDRCEVGGSFSLSAANLYAGYTSWCDSANETPMGKKAFGISLAERGFRSMKGTGGVRRWIGLRLLESPSGASGVSGMSGGVFAENTISRTGKHEAHATHATHATQTSDSSLDCPHPNVFLDGRCSTCNEVVE